MDKDALKASWDARRYETCEHRKAQPSSYATLAHHKPIEPYREVCALAHTLTGSNYLPESLGRGGDSSDSLRFSKLQ